MEIASISKKIFCNCFERGIPRNTPVPLSFSPSPSGANTTEKRVRFKFRADSNSTYVGLVPSERIQQKIGEESPCLFRTFKTYKLVANITTNVVGGSVVLYNKELYLFLGRNKSGFARLLRPDLSIYSGTPNIDKLYPVKTLPCYFHNSHYYCVTKHGLISLTTGKLMSEQYTNDIKRLGYYLGDHVEDFSQCSTININNY